jgi:hypothetical protein
VLPDKTLSPPFGDHAERTKDEQEGVGGFGNHHSSNRQFKDGRHSVYVVVANPYPRGNSAIYRLGQSKSKRAFSLAVSCVKPQQSWSDEIEPPPAEWWSGEEPGWNAPEVTLDDGRVLVLDADDPVPADEWPVYLAN